jgi:hypothetical protein
MHRVLEATLLCAVGTFGLPLVAREETPEALDCRSPDGRYEVRVDAARHEGEVRRGGERVQWSDLDCTCDAQGCGCHSRHVWDAGFAVRLERTEGRYAGSLWESGFVPHQLATLSCEAWR